MSPREVALVLTLLSDLGYPDAALAPMHAGDTIEGGYGAAIFATNDLPALGAMHAAIELGLQVPDDLSVIGITDIDLARQTRPALSMVAVPTAGAAAMAIALLLDLAANPRVNKVNVVWLRT